MKVLLINPSQLMIYGTPMPQAYPPLGLLYVGAVLEKDGHEVTFVDIDVDGFDDAKLESYVREYGPGMVGVSTTTPSMNDALHAAEVVKRATDAPVVFGGIHPTIAAQECMESEYIDIVVKGEGEITAVELARALEKGGDLSAIEGVLFKKKGKVVENGDRPLIEDLDTIPFPARHLLNRPEKYTPADAMRTPATPIITSRGCSGKCTFCCTKQIFGRKYRFRSVDNIIAEIDYCIGRYGMKEFHIADDNFIAHRQRTIDFCKRVVDGNYDLGFFFFNGLRADFVSPEILKALKSIGVFSVGYGVESGNQAILDRIKKGLTLDKLRYAFRISKEEGFKTWAFFIIGLPGDTPETIRDTIDFAKELDPDFVKFLILKPYPGSEVFNELKSLGLIENFNYTMYGVYTAPVHRLEEMTSAEILYWQKRAYREFYLRPKVILRHIMRIRSLTQLKVDIHSGVFIFKKMLTKSL